MPPEIRPIGQDELPAFIEALSTAFLERPDVDRVAQELDGLWDLGRTWSAQDDGRICGTFRSFASEITVPGGRQLPTAAVAAVTVLPTHRRRGILRALVAAEHGAARERGEPIALLNASEYPIYGRFGYGPATRRATWTLEASDTAFHGSSSGSVELVAPGPAAREAMLEVFEAWRGRQAGEIRRRDYRWDFDLGLRESAWEPRWKGFVALHRDATGQLDGYVRYRAEEKWEHRQPRSVARVDELHALDDAAYAALWRYVAEIDLVATVVAENRRVEERLPWLLSNARAASASDVGDGMWVRLLDLPRALEARTYEVPVRLVIEAADPEAAGGRTRVELDGGPDGATCRPTDAAPDLSLDIAALGAAYLGGIRLRDAVVARGVDEARAGALDAADTSFRTRDEPWCSTFF